MVRVSFPIEWQCGMNEGEMKRARRFLKARRLIVWLRHKIGRRGAAGTTGKTACCYLFSDASY